MKYCSKCGVSLNDDAVVCPSCGCLVDSSSRIVKETKESSTIKTIAFVFMIVATISSGWLLIPLIWCIPMTVRYYRYTKGEGTISTAFKVCTLLFVSLISGILMLVDED
ncbi:MAG: hypothetical protein MR659_04855 [Mollicutes bacterium]|nr:hypothetical protein [Mollicutes bacterium]